MNAELAFTPIAILALAFANFASLISAVLLFSPTKDTFGSARSTRADL